MSMFDITRHNDHTYKPEAPWDEWSAYANCWTCRHCGAAAGFQCHNPGCTATVARCDHHDSHDLSADRPTGKRCEAPATHRITWDDGRFSFGCADHLEIEDSATVKPIGIAPMMRNVT